MRFFPFLLVGLLAVVQYSAEAAPPPKKVAPKTVARPATTAAATASTSASAIRLLESGIAARNSKQDAQAEQAFKQALKIMTPLDPNRIVAVDGLAHLYYEQDRYAEALPYAKMAHPLAIRRSGTNSAHEANTLYLIANIQHHLDDFPGAKAGYQRSVAIYELPGNAGKNDRTYSSALENLGSIFFREQALDKALAYYQRALALRRKLPAENCGTLLENMGLVFLKQERSEDAARYYEQALAEYQKNTTQNKDAIDRVSFTLGNLAGKSVQASGGTAGYNGQYYEAAKKAFNEDRNYEEAARQFQLTLDEVTRVRPKEQHFIALLESYLGQSLFHAGEIDAALPHLEKANAWESANLKANDLERLHLSLILGLAYNSNGDYAQSRKYLEYVRANAAKDSKQYENALITLADTLCHQGDFHEGKALYNEALDLVGSKGADGEQQVKHIRYKLGLLDKMFQSQLGIAELIGFSSDGLRRWSMEKAPVTILIHTGAPLPQWNERYRSLVLKAFQTWQEALPDQIRFAFTDNPEQADVTVNWTDRPLDQTDQTLDPTGGQTDLEAKVGLYKLVSKQSFFLSAEIFLALQSQGKLRTDGEIYMTALHEIGHMLGLQHSSHLSDIMCAVGNYAVPGPGKELARLSENDIQAARVLYRQMPAVTNPPGISLAAYQKFDAMTNPGIEAVKSGNYKEASRIFEQARALYSQDPYINYLSGLSAYNTGDYKEAKEIFENLPMPQSKNGFSVDSQLGLIYVELGHKYNKFGRKNRAISNGFYDQGVAYLEKALQDPGISLNQKAYLYEKLREGKDRSRPMPVYSWGTMGMPYRLY